MNLKGQIAYLGTHYYGWQKTSTGPSIEACLEKALEQILREKVALQAASRTDRGVHAEGQIINFFTQKNVLDLRLLQISVQALLPKDISIYSIEKAEDNFHPTLDAIAKEYHYLICNSDVQLPFYKDRSWHFRYPLDFDLMLKAKELLIGKHDFSAFSNEKCESVIREIYSIEITLLKDGRICISILGNSFLYKMMRNLVGTLVYIGCGKINIDDLPKILEGKDRTKAGMTAPAHGLCLKKVYYANNAF